jgi:hypothetical protein
MQTDASPMFSQAWTHDSAPMWIAPPTSQWTCTTTLLPVSRRTHRNSLSVPRRHTEIWSTTTISPESRTHFGWLP